MKKIDILVCYDVNTTHEDGKRRLRKVAKACESYGQRVQYSVFECTLTPANYEKLLEKIGKIMNSEVDSLRVYFLQGSRESFVHVYGRDSWVDFEAPLVV